MSNRMKDTLDGLGVEVVQWLESDKDSNGKEILRYDCKLNRRSVSVEWYFNGELDVFYTDSHEQIFNGLVN